MIQPFDIDTAALQLAQAPFQGSPMNGQEKGERIVNFWADYYIRHEQMMDRRQEAQNYRLVSRLRVATRDRTTVFCQMMALAGRRLINWGRRLEAQYGA